MNDSAYNRFKSQAKQDVAILRIVNRTLAACVSSNPQNRNIDQKVIHYMEQSKVIASKSSAVQQNSSNNTNILKMIWKNFKRK